MTMAPEKVDWHSISDVPPPVRVRIYTWWPQRELDDDDEPSGPIVGGVCVVAEFDGTEWETPEWFQNMPNASYFYEDFEYALQPMFWTALPDTPPQVAALLSQQDVKETT